MNLRKDHYELAHLTCVNVGVPGGLRSIPLGATAHVKRCRLSEVRMRKCKQLLTMDLLALATMKNAVKCEK